ncbi:hypothetical protein IAD21_04586 [Abditibacteriota bacterium]|nr:hypothetical protein IAD21_04586 [Abditibacteriota bacterium]
MNNTQMIRSLLVGGSLLLAVSCTPKPAFAQWNAYDAMMSNNVYSRGWVNPYDNTYTNAYKFTYRPITTTYAYFGGSPASRAARRKARVQKMPARQRTEMERFLKYNGTMYKPSKSMDTASTLSQTFATNLKVPAPKMKTVMQEMWNLYVKQAKDQNAPATDLARTMAYCISANYYYYTGGTGVPETQVAVLRKNLRETLAEDPKFRAMTDSQKQQLNESMVMLTHFAALGFEVVAKKAPAEKRTQVREGFKKLAGVNLRGILGVDASRVAFNSDGLLIKPA